MSQLYAPLRLSRLASNPAEVASLLDQAFKAHLIDDADMADWNARGLNSKSKLKRLLDRMSTTPRSPTAPGGLHKLWDLIVDSEALRGRLKENKTWRQVFSCAGLPLESRFTVAPLTKFGRCHYLYRIQDSKRSYIARYHDPIGRDFLPRYEPHFAIAIYRAVEELFRIALGKDAVVTTLFPANDGSWTGTAASGEITRVCRRLLIQPDYQSMSFLLSEYRRVDPPLPREELVRLLVENLARLHSRSRRLFQRSRAPHGADLLAQKYSQHRVNDRFPTSERYLGWLMGPNWMSRSVLAGLSGRPSEPWSGVCREIGIEPAVLLSSCRALWRESAEAMKRHGGLAHMDWTPRNCFVDRESRSKTRVFDFDYVAIVDPAYDLAITINSCLTVFLDQERPADEAETICLVRRILEIYPVYFAESPPRRFAAAHDGLTRREIDELIRRASAFAGLAVCTVLEGEASSSHRRRDPPGDGANQYRHRFSAAVSLLKSGLRADGQSVRQPR